MFMQKNFKEVNFIFPTELDLDLLLNSTPYESFSEKSIDFLNELSLILNKNANIRNYPDVATFAFFCRKANIINLKRKYLLDQTIRLGRGIVFHIAPSNVPVNFAYSLLCGILSGNINIVRIPTKKFEQISIICNAIYKLSLNEKYKPITDRLALVRYDRQSMSTTYFSSICDVRVIWGGDATIEQIRKSSIPTRSFDVTFADRYSLCVINADVFINETAPEKIASAFYNDTYLFDQNACTAPHLILWLGAKTNVEKSQTIFWNKLHDLVKTKYTVQPVIAVDKLTSFYNQASQLKNIHKVVSSDNLLWRIKLDNLPTDIDKYRCSSGYFSEYHLANLSELVTIINRKYQTLAYYGIEKNDLVTFMNETKPVGIDRIVPIGKTTDFSLTWDGYNLISTLTRSCEII